MVLAFKATLLPAELMAQGSCTNIGGLWRIEEEGTLTCTVTVGSQTFTESDPLGASDTITITQSTGSCSFTYDPGLLGGYYRTAVTGEVSGTNITTTGGALIPAPGFQLIESSFR